MKKTFAIFTLLALQLSIAKANPGKFLEIEIDKMDYDKPAEVRGNAGVLNFKSVNLDWDGMQVNIQNTDKVFDTKIYYTQTFLSFVSTRLRLGFNLAEDSGFHSIQGMDISNSKFIVNPDFFSFNGDEFEFIDQKTKSRLNLKKFNLFCSGDGKYDLTTPVGIIAGCLTDFYVSGTSGNLADAEIEYRDESGEKPFYLNTSIDQIELREGKITTDVATGTIITAPFEINLKNLKATCDKDPELTELDTAKLAKDCKNSLFVENNLITINNSAEKSFFDLAVKQFKITNKNFDINLSNAVVGDPKSQTTLSKLRVNCQKHEDIDILELQDVLAECFDDGQVSIANIFSEDKKKVTREDFKIEDFFEDGLIIDSDNGGNNRDYNKAKDSDISNIQIRMKNNKMNLDAKVKFIWNFNLNVQANIRHYPKEEKIILSVEKTKLPLGIRWRKLLMFFLKKFLVVDFIQYDGNNIIITL